MINVCEELADVALEHPAGARIIFAYDISKRPKTIHRSMRPLVVAAGKRIGYECPIEEWIELAINCVVDETVPHACLVNVARLGIGYFECLIAAVTIRPIYQIGVK